MLYMSYSDELIEKIKEKYKDQITQEDALEIVRNIIKNFFKTMEKKLTREIKLSEGKIKFEYDDEGYIIVQLSIADLNNKIHSISFVRLSDKINIIISNSQENPFDIISLEESIQYNDNANKYICKSKKYGNFSSDILDKYLELTFGEGIER
ncbi:hypothetical protein AB8U03_03585 [Clostridium sp. Mt-5]|uniref:Uncharacterized protein n=1 Tax=Clostridium moutaii TaxID=3240932 RepID=A0ABV4BL69_9CLOT